MAMNRPRPQPMACLQNAMFRKKWVKNSKEHDPEILFATVFSPTLREVRLFIESTMVINRPARMNFGASPAGVVVVDPRPLGAIAATRAGGVPQARVLQLFTDLMAPIQALHSQGRVHGAISPDTIGLDEWGKAQMLDPVSAKASGTGASSERRASGFNAFEQYTGDPAWVVGPWTDVYALAAVAYSLVTGSAPPSTIDRCVRDTYDALAPRQLPGYSPSFLAAIDAGLRIFPSERPQSLSAFATAIGVPPPAPAASTSEAAAVSAVPSAGQAQPPLTSQIEPPVRLKPLAIFLLLLVTGSAAAFFWLRLAEAPEVRHEPASITAAPRGVFATRETFRPVLPVAPRRTESALNGDPAIAPLTPGAVIARAGAIAYDRVRPVLESPAASPARLPDAGSPAPARPPEASSTAADAVTAPPAAPRAEQTDPSSAKPDASSAGQPAPPQAGTSEAPTAPPAPQRAVVPSIPQEGVEGAVPAQPVRSAEIRLFIRPWGEVFVDGVSRGVTPPVKTLPLSPGRHAVSIHNPGAAPFKVTLTVRSGEKTSIAHSFD